MIRYRKRFKIDKFDPSRDPIEDMPTVDETEDVAERLCVCKCGNEWWAEAGTKTACDGGVLHFVCPHASTFEVPPL